MVAISRVWASGWRRLIVAALGVAALVVGVSATASSALRTTATWTVHPGGNSKAESGSQGSGLRFSHAFFSFTCEASSFEVSLKSGSGLMPLKLGKVRKFNPLICGAGGSTGGAWTFTPEGLPWTINAVSYSAGVTRIRFTGVDFKVRSAGSAPCTASIDGTAANADDGRFVGNYTNGTGGLSIPLNSVRQDLHVFDATGCSSILRSGRVSFSGNWNWQPKQKITSP
jgi:hypothetical protein